MATGRFLIDLTDQRLKTPQNHDVVDYIRRTNPSAHSDVADALIRAAKGLAGVSHYCPAPANYAFVVLHTSADRIFAIAYGQHGLAFRLPETAIAEALADRGTAQTAIGPGWVMFPPWPVDELTAVTKARLKRWCERAYRHALIA